MALVQELYDSIDIEGYARKEQIACGRFFEDDKYYLAVLGVDCRLQFYTLTSCKPIKIMDVVLTGFKFEPRKLSISTYYMAGEKDRVLVCSTINQKCDSYLWDEDKLLHLTSFRVEDDDESENEEEDVQLNVGVSTLPFAPRLYCVYSGSLIHIYSGSHLVYSTTVEGVIGGVLLMSSKICIVGIFNKGVRYFIKIGSKRTITHLRPKIIVMAIPTNRDSETELILFEQCRAVIVNLDDPDADFNRRVDLENVNAIGTVSLLKYEEVSGNPLFIVNNCSIFLFNGLEALPIKRETNSPIYLFHPFLEGAPGSVEPLYYYNVNKDLELELHEIYSTNSLPMSYENCMVRNLLGNNYYFIKDGKLAKLSKKLWFESVRVLSNSASEPFSKAFSVSDRHVLVVGHTAARVFDLNSGKCRKCWYRPGETVFANARYQVQPRRIFTKKARYNNPLASDITYANIHGDNLLIGSANEVAVLSSSCEILEIFNEEYIRAIFPGGYATSEKVKIFGKPEIKVPNIFTAGYINSVLIVEAQGPNPLYSIDDGGLVECNLGVNTLLMIRECGAGSVLQTKDETVLLHNREFIRLGGVGSECILSKDLKTCLNIENGVVTLMKNIGIQSLINVDPLCIQKEAVNYRLCKDQVVWSHVELDSLNIVHKKSLNNRTILTRKLKYYPGFTYAYIILHDNYLVELKYPPAHDRTPAVVTSYQWEDLKEISRAEIPLQHARISNTYPKIAERRLLVVSALMNVCHEKGNIFLSNYSAPEPNFLPLSTLYVLNVDEEGNLQAATEDGPRPINNGQLEYHFGDLRFLAGVVPWEYPREGDHMLVGLRNMVLKVIPSTNVPQKLRNEIRRAIRNRYTLSKYHSSTYHLGWAGTSFEFQDLDYESLKLSVSRQIHLPPACTALSISLATTSDPLTDYDPLFLASAGSKVYAITPLPDTHDSEAIHEFISELVPRNELIPTDNFIDANALLSLLLDESNHDKFRQIGEDPITWRKTLLSIIK